MNYQKIIFTIIILVIILGFSGLGCKQQKTQEEKPTSELFTQDPASFDEKFNEIKNAAEGKAKNWQKDAKLVYVSTKISTNLNPNFIQHTFVYDSSVYPNDHWTITIEVGNNSSIRALIPKEDYLGSDLQQILPLYWKINFASALQKSYEAGGKDFISQNPNNFKIELNLGRSKGESLRWVAQYSTLDETNTSEFKIDAASGELIK